jgi:Spy/CpxP family protein refolding chaperone
MTALFNHLLKRRKPVMKPWIKRSLIGIFGASILVGGITACASHHHGFGANLTAEEVAQYRTKMVDRIGGKLDLNEDQKKRLSALTDKLHEQRLALAGQSKDPRADIATLVAGDKFDKARAQTLVTEKTTALQSHSPEVIAAMADFYDSLNASQQQKVRDFMAQRRGWWHRG